MSSQFKLWHTEAQAIPARRLWGSVALLVCSVAVAVFDGACNMTGFGPAASDQGNGTSAGQRVVGQRGAAQDTDAGKALPQLPDFALVPDVPLYGNILPPLVWLTQNRTTPAAAGNPGALLQVEEDQALAFGRPGTKLPVPGTDFGGMPGVDFLIVFDVPGGRSVPLGAGGGFSAGVESPAALRGVLGVDFLIVFDVPGGRAVPLGAGGAFSAGGAELDTSLLLTPCGGLASLDSPEGAALLEE